MSRPKTQNVGDLTSLLLPQDPLMLVVEQAVLRHNRSAHVTPSLAEQIATKIAGAITLDHLHTGQRLLEQDISEVLQVSRAPVREALRILERDRLVEFQPRRGALVTQPDPAELRDIFFVRSTLYAALFRLVMAERPDDLEALLASHLPEIHAKSSRWVNDYAVAAFELNMAMADLSSNRILADQLTSIALRTLRYVRLGLAAAPESMSQMIGTWDELYEAVRSRDTDRVVAVAERKISVIQDVAVHAVTDDDAAGSPAEIAASA